MGSAPFMSALLCHYRTPASNPNGVDLNRFVFISPSQTMSPLILSKWSQVNRGNFIPTAPGNNFHLRNEKWFNLNCYDGVEIFHFQLEQFKCFFVSFSFGNLVALTFQWNPLSTVRAKWRRNCRNHIKSTLTESNWLSPRFLQHKPERKRNLTLFIKIN